MRWKPVGAGWCAPGDFRLCAFRRCHSCDTLSFSPVHSNLCGPGGCGPPCGLPQPHRGTVHTGTSAYFAFCPRTLPHAQWLRRSCSGMRGPGLGVSQGATRKTCNLLRGSGGRRSMIRPCTVGAAVVVRPVRLVPDLAVVCPSCSCSSRSCPGCRCPSFSCSSRCLSCSCSSGSCPGCC